MKRNSNQPSLFNFGVKKIKNNKETEGDEPNALQTQLDTNINNEYCIIFISF